MQPDGSVHSAFMATAERILAAFVATPSGSRFPALGIPRNSRPSAPSTPAAAAILPRGAGSTRLTFPCFPRTPSPNWAAPLAHVPSSPTPRATALPCPCVLARGDGPGADRLRQPARADSRRARQSRASARPPGKRRWPPAPTRCGAFRRARARSWSPTPSPRTRSGGRSVSAGRRRQHGSGPYRSRLCNGSDRRVCTA